MARIWFHAFLSTIYIQYCLAAPVGAFENTYGRNPAARALVLPIDAGETVSAQRASIPMNQKRHDARSQWAPHRSSSQSTVDTLAFDIGIITMGSVGGLLAMVSVFILIRFHHEQLKAKGSHSSLLSPWLSHVPSLRSSLPVHRNMGPSRWTAAPRSNQTYQPLLKDPIRLEDCRDYLIQRSADSERVVLKRSSTHSQVIGLGISVDRRQLEEHLRRLSQSRSRGQPPRKSVRFESQVAALACLDDVTIPRTPSVQTWAQFTQSGFM